MKKQFGRKPSGDKSNFGKKSFSDKSSWKKSGGGTGKSGFHKKKYSSDKNQGGNEERNSGDKPFRKKTFGDKPFTKKSFGDKEDRGERKFGNKPYEKKSFGDKPFAKKPYSNKEDRGERKFNNKPYEKKSFGDKANYAKKDSSDRPFSSKEGSYGRPFKKKTFGDRKQFSKSNDFQKSRDDKFSNDEWQVFENADEAKAFIKSNREEKKSSGKSFHQTQKEFSNDNRPLRAAAYKDNETSVRLNRFIANTGICSRREADDLIQAGVVKVNGKIVTELGTKVGPNDTIHYGDQLLRREKMSYVLLNKPKDYITTTDDPQERKTVMSLIEEAGNERIYPVGRLDRNTTGLLLFTNDGDLAQRLTHPKNGVRKIYHVSLDKNLRAEDFDKILKGYEMEDGFMKADELSFVGDGLDKKEVGIVIHSGRNRIVRRLFEGVGYDVVKLDRVVYAGLTKKNLPRGHFRHLTTEEVGMLRMQIGGEKKQNFKKSDPKHNKGKRPRK